MYAAVIVVLVVQALIVGCLGAYVATQKGRQPAEGFIFGLLFSLVGVLIEGLLPTDTAELVARVPAPAVAADRTSSWPPAREWVATWGAHCGFRAAAGDKRCRRQVTHALFSDEAGELVAVRCGDHIEQERGRLMPRYPALVLAADEYVAH